MKITVLQDNQSITIEYRGEISLLNAIKEAGIYVPAYCNGRGTCGKCRIRLVEGVLEITPEDRRILMADDLANGIRLSCKAYPQVSCSVQLMTGNEQNFEVLGAARAAGILMQPEEPLGIAVDIGTTTIAMELVGLTSGTIYAADSRINHQRAYGADVISRIQAANNGEKAALQKCIIMDLSAGFSKLTNVAQTSPDTIKNIVIAANTTMCHLLLGYSCETLGVSPFTPVNINTIKRPASQLFGTDYNNAGLTILPGISTFVGADITAGLLVADFAHSDQPVMLIDLGTNGEMAIGTKDRIITSSTAAGPAFEGGNISCGIGSIPGAISQARFNDKIIHIKTIGDQPPVGICGTGVLEITSELVRHELIDETGLLDEDYFEAGVSIATRPDGTAITFTQKDIREIQLAKAAVRAGIEVLIKRFTTTPDNIHQIYLAGGFGFHIDIEKAITIGLIPEAFRSKVKILGNTSLKGARACLLDTDALDAAARLAALSEEISLGNDPDFNNAYMDAMYFENA